MATLTNATEIDGLAKYIVGETDGGWGYRYLGDAAGAFDAIMEHPVFPTREEAVAAARAEDAESIALERKQAAAELGGRIGAAMARDVIAGAMPREWTGLDPQNADQIPANLADLIDEIEYAARSAYLDALERDAAGRYLDRHGL